MFTTHSFKKLARTGQSLILRCGKAFDRIRYRGYYSPSRDNFDHELHIQEAVQWLVRAQDAGTDRGISYGVTFGRGFEESYPETTGYIICTFLDLAEEYGDSMYLRRAIEMGDWEIAIQLNSGAVMGGRYNTNPAPALFNTGQVLLGWAALLYATGESRFRDAGLRAAEWMVSMQEPNGNWIRGNSEFANPKATVYNVKAAWGLAEMGAATDRNDLVEAAVQNGLYAISKQRPNGWIAECCLTDADHPLTHTLAYTLQGLIGIGMLTGRNDLISAATLTADALLSLMKDDGFIPGRIDSSFEGVANWCCLTGTAQTAIVWWQLYRLTAKSEYCAGALKANRYLKAHHDVSNLDPAIRGGVPGSWPTSGGYMPFRILNWATKFFVDTLVMERRYRNSNPQPVCRGQSEAPIDGKVTRNS